MQCRSVVKSLLVMVGVIAMLCSRGVSAASGGSPWAWGWNYFGELGNGTTINSNVSMPVSGLTGVTAIAAGWYHSLGLKNDGTVWAWGNNEAGQLGNSTYTDSNVPVQVSGLTGVTALAAGSDSFHGLALKNDGTVWAWGSNHHGELGNGTNASSNVPIQVSALTGVTTLAAGWIHSLALKNDGTVWAWGWNIGGQLGNGTNTDSNVPVQVSGLSGVTALAAGDAHSLALKNDGTVWAWGANGSGELGNGTNTDSKVPVEVSGLTGVTAIAAGSDHSLILKNDGTVWAWGWNKDGQLGNGTNTDSNVPVKVSRLTGVTALAAGYEHSLALKNDGTVWAWGWNKYGQLGNGTTINSNVPIQVSGLTGVTALAAGGWHSLALGNAPTLPPPTVSSITPNSGTNTGSVNITNLSGTGFVSGAVVKLTKSGQADMVATNVTVVSATQITCTFDLTGKATGAWNVLVTNPDTQSGTLTSGFTVNNPAPTVTSITPDSGLNNGTVSITNLAGTGFLSGATVRLTKSGQTVLSATSVAVVSSTKITCAFDLTRAATGQWDVVVANTDGQSGTLTSGFTVNNPAPTVTSITPDSGLNNGTVNITNLAGAGFLGGATVKLAKSGQRDLAVTSVMVVNSTKIICIFDLTGAATGQWNVVVTNTDTQSGALPNGFTVNNPAPTVTSITPNSGLNNGTVNITNLAGTGFLSGATVKLTRSGQTDISATSVVVVSSTKITCAFDLTGAATGQWNVVVTNTDGQSATLANGFTIGNPAPTVTTITLNSGLNNGPVAITNLAGTGFQTGAVVKLTQPGQADIPATNVVVVIPTQITCTFDLNGKAIDQWNVVVTNTDGQSATLANGFTITAATTQTHDVAITNFTASPNPVSRGATVSFNVTVKNLGTYTENNVTFTISYGSMRLAGPIELTNWKPGQEFSGVLKLPVPNNQKPGDYLITGQLSTVTGETNTANNSQTVKLTVR